MSTSSGFPDPVYADTILAPQFAASQRWLFGPMLDASEAHLLMLQATGLMTAAQAGRVWDALQALRQAGAASFAYDPHVEDLFFQMEARIVDLAGEEAGGNLHLARSRNDLDAAMARLALRRTLLDVHVCLERLRQTLLRRIEEHVETLMPGHTHTQPAQPTTLGHFLAATAEALERDAVRVQAAFARTNRGPLGAAALTTTGFPIDRELTARLLGFDDVVTNSYDAIGGVDYALESLAALTICALGLSRLVHELLLWATREYGTLRIDDSFIQISSIMPQKRNPVVLEHLRARVGWVLGSAAHGPDAGPLGGVRRHGGRGGRVLRAAVPDLRARHRLPAPRRRGARDLPVRPREAGGPRHRRVHDGDRDRRHAGPPQRALVPAGPPRRLDDRAAVGRRAGGASTPSLSPRRPARRSARSWGRRSGSPRSSLAPRWTRGRSCAPARSPAAPPRRRCWPTWSRCARRCAATSPGASAREKQIQDAAAERQARAAALT